MQTIDIQYDSKFIENIKLGIINQLLTDKDIKKEQYDEVIKNIFNNKSKETQKENECKKII